MDGGEGTRNEVKVRGKGFWGKWISVGKYTFASGKGNASGNLDEQCQQLGFLYS